MTAKERILTIRLLDMAEHEPKFIEKFIETPIKTPEYLTLNPHQEQGEH